MLLGGHASGGRFFALFRHLGASRSHLDRDWSGLRSILESSLTDVDEASLYLQSGNGAAIPAQAYMRIASPARFFETFEAFGL